MSSAAAARRRKARNALDRCPGYEPNPMFAYLERCKNCGFAKAEHTVIRSEGAALTSYLDPAQAAREKEERRKELERQQNAPADAGFSYLKVDERTRKDAEAKAAAASQALEDEAKKKQAVPFKVVKAAKPPPATATTTTSSSDGSLPVVALKQKPEPAKELKLPATPAQRKSVKKTPPVAPARKSEPQPDPVPAPKEPDVVPTAPTPLQRDDTQATLDPLTRGSMASMDPLDPPTRGSMASLSFADPELNHEVSVSRMSARASNRMSRFMSGRMSSRSLRRPGLRTQTSSSRLHRLTAGKGPRDVTSVREAHLKQISRLMKVTTRGAERTRQGFRKYEEPAAATLELLAAPGGIVRWRKAMSVDWTQLHAFAWNRDELKLERTLRGAAGRALVDAPTGDTGETALSLAAKRGSRACAFALLAAGADPNLGDHFGLTPAHYAARAGSTELVDMLAQAKADLRSASSELGLSVLHVACRYADADTVRALLSARAEVDARDMRGWTPIFYAVLRPRQSALVQLLVDAQADLLAASPEGLTPMHCAALSDDPEQVAAIVENGGRMDAQDADGWTPVHYTARYNAAQALQRLLEYGAKPKPRSEAPFTPYEVAEHFGSGEAKSALENARGFEKQKIVLDSEDLDVEPVLGKYVRMDEELDLAELQTIREVLEYADGGGGGGCCVVS